MTVPTYNVKIKSRFNHLQNSVSIKTNFWGITRVHKHSIRYAIEMNTRNYQIHKYSSLFRLANKWTHRLVLASIHSNCKLNLPRTRVLPSNIKILTWANHVRTITVALTSISNVYETRQATMQTKFCPEDIKHVL